MIKVIRWVGAFLILLVAACVPSVKTPAATSEVTIVVTPTQAATPTAETDVFLEKLKNSTITAPNLQKSIQLANGQYSDGTNTVTMLDQIAFGDLNNDQNDDAAVLLSENTGGTGNFVSLVVMLSQGGLFTQTGSMMIDDRPLIKSVQIVDGVIELNVTIHGINDSMADPTLAELQTYKLLENQLTLMRLASNTQDNAEPSIVIEAPADGSEISDIMQVKGSMAVAPFENNLRFSLYDLAGNLLYQEGFMVNAADPGGPATFDNPIALPAIVSGSKVRLELAELSMADGSLMEMNSVVLTVK
jgi:hypothetical protein